jgi:hypothetical protein
VAHATDGVFSQGEQLGRGVRGEESERKEGAAENQGSRDAKAGFWRKITEEYTTELAFSEAIYSERQKIGVERLLGAANDDGFFDGKREAGQMTSMQWASDPSQSSD